MAKLAFRNNKAIRLEVRTGRVALLRDLPRNITGTTKHETSGQKSKNKAEYLPVLGYHQVAKRDGFETNDPLRSYP